MTADLKKLQNGSDIRGIALPGVEGENPNLTKNEIEAISMAFVKYICEKKDIPSINLRVAIGCDSRLSGPYIKALAKKTMEEFGVTVLDAGLASTPAMFMSTVLDGFKYDGAIMITASHLPFNRNGMKFFDCDGGFQKDEIKKIISYAEVMINEGESQISETSTDFGGDPSLMNAYADHLKAKICGALAEEGITGDKPLAGLTIAVDAGNGAGGFYGEKILAPLGADVKAYYVEPDGTFPNHVPNPEDKVAMAAISQAVLDTKADLGIIFDTDVDRSAAVTEDGKEVARNGIIAMAAALLAKDHQGATIVTDSITSPQLKAFIEDELGMVHLRFKRGYKNVINKAMELQAEGIDAPLAIETSGHAALGENYYLDDGAYLATKIVIEAAKLKAQGKALSTMIEKLEEPLEAKEVRMKLLCEDFSAYGDKVLEELKAWATDDCELSLEEPNYEGVRINFGGDAPWGWCLLRKSLHDPIMPLNAEADKEGGVEEILAKLKGFLTAYADLDTSVL